MDFLVKFISELNDVNFSEINDFPKKFMLYKLQIIFYIFIFLIAIFLLFICIGIYYRINE